MTEILTINIPGIPRPKGSKKIYDNGVLVEASKHVKNYMELITLLTMKTMREKHVTKLETEPVGIDIQFLFLKARSNKKPFMTQTPDIDKLTRAVLDALTGQAFHDDSQVVEIGCRKLWGEENKTTITIYEVGAIKLL